MARLNVQAPDTPVDRLTASLMEHGHVVIEELAVEGAAAAAAEEKARGRIAQLRETFEEELKQQRWLSHLERSVERYQVEARAQRVLEQLSESKAQAR